MMEPSVACLWYFADRETNSLRPGRKSPRCPQRVSSRRRPGCTETVPRIKFGKSVSPTTIMAMLWLDCAGARVQQVRLPVRRDEDLPPEDPGRRLRHLQRGHGGSPGGCEISNSVDIHNELLIISELSQAITRCFLTEDIILTPGS